MKNNSLTNVLLIVNIILFVFIITLGITHLFNKRKVVYVDSIRLMKEYKEIVKAGQAYGIQIKEWNMRADTLEDELENMMKNFEEKKGTLSKPQIEARIKDINIKKQQFEEYKSVMNNKAQEEGARITSQIVSEMNKKIGDFGEENNYRFIMGANGNGSLLYGSSKYDITDEVLKYLNKH